MANPEVMTNDVWTWLIETEAWPHSAHEAAGNGEKQSPGWCFSRYGQSETQLSDGRTLYIGGEHEDFYDEDFYIYNDVIVKFPDGSIATLGYPEDIFPPTDFHTATEVGNDVFVIGCLGYPEQRQSDATKVYVLDLASYSIRPFEVEGEQPPSIYKHSARYSAEQNAIFCEGGKSTHLPTGETVENIATWRLCLGSGGWTKTFEKPWTRWILVREDESRNELWELSQLEWAEKTGREDDYTKTYRQAFFERNHTPNISMFIDRYSPNIEHEKLPDDEDEFRCHRITVGDVVVRFLEDSYSVTVTVEGNLAEDLMSALKSHGLETLSHVEGVPYKIIEL